MEKATIKDLIWLLCYLHCQWGEINYKEGETGVHDPVSDILSNKSKFETWAAFNSLSATGKVSRTNHGVLAPLIRSPPTSSPALYAALCLAR